LLTLLLGNKSINQSLSELHLFVKAYLI
jgi:hypothetical protein